MQQTINTSLFFYSFGVLTGLIVKWTDIVPIIGGFMLGITVSRIAPEFISVSELPVAIQSKINDLLNLQSTNSDK